MPIYDYHCKACNSTEEYRLPSSEADPVCCISCNKVGQLERKAIHSFNTTAKSNRSSISPADEVRMRGGKKVATKLDFYGDGRVSISDVYSVPQASSN